MHFALFEDTQNKGLCHYFHGDHHDMIATDHDSLLAVLAAIEACPHPLIGCINYEAVFHCDNTLKHLIKPSQQPLCHFVQYEHYELMPHAAVDKLLRAHSQNCPGTLSHLKCETDWQQYNKDLHSIRAHLQAGNSYQINYTARMTARMHGCSIDLYRQLRQQQPVRYSALLHFGERQIVSLSPELFFETKDRLLTTRPMKGTMQRGVTPKADAQFKHMLQSQAKTRAENIMIVDLLRNDCHAIAEPDSVKVQKCCHIETYPTLHQMVSTIQCQLREGVTFTDIIYALFPCGSITGVPKRSTIQIIQQLEQRQRGIYTGCIGIVQPNGDACFNVAIRTLDIDAQQAEVGIGGGIIADSVPEDEYQEMLLKAAFLQSVQVDFALITSIAYQRETGLQHHEQHMQRLADSADVFGFAFNATNTLAAIQAAVTDCEGDQHYKIRCAIHKNGHIDIKVIATQASSQVILKQLIHSEIADNNPFLQHKTTHPSVRNVYDQYRQQHCTLQNEDVLFINQCGYISETSRHNIFICQNGKWFTPPLSCGCLPGIMRTHVMHEKNAQEKCFTPADSLDCDGIWVCNSITGLVQADITCIEEALHAACATD